MEAYPFTVDDASSIARVGLFAELAQELLRRAHDSALAARELIEVGETIAIVDDVRPVGPGIDPFADLKERLKELRLRVADTGGDDRVATAHAAAAAAVDATVGAYARVREEVRRHG